MKEACAKLKEAMREVDATLYMLGNAKNDGQY